MDANPELPQHLILRIFSFLPHPYSARTSVLSKIFRSSWRSFPTIVLDQYSYRFNSLCLSHEDRDRFVTTASQFVRTREEEIDRVQRFTLKLSNPTADGDDRVDQLVRCAVLRCAGEVALEISFRKYYPLPEIHAGWGISVTVLKLTGIRFNLDDLISSCGSLQEVALRRCDLWGKIRVSSPKLRILTLKCFRSESATMEIEAPNLQTFVYNRIGPFGINLNSCTSSLAELSLDFATITDDWVEDLIPKFLKLQTLNLRSCTSLIHIKISSPTLKSIRLSCTAGEKSVRIHAPKLVFLRFCGKNNRDIDIEIAHCELLKHLELESTRIGDEWLQFYLPKLVALEELKLIECRTSNRIRIRHERLASLELRYGEELGEADIETPKLRALSYGGQRRLMFVSSFDDGIIKFWRYGPTDKFIDFLRVLDHGTELTISLHSLQGVIFAKPSDFWQAPQEHSMEAPILTLPGPNYSFKIQKSTH